MMRIYNIWPAKLLLILQKNEFVLDEMFQQDDFKIGHIFGVQKRYVNKYVDRRTFVLNRKYRKQKMKKLYMFFVIPKIWVKGFTTTFHQI